MEQHWYNICEIKRVSLIRRYLILSLVLVVFLLNACSENEEVVKLKEKDLSGLLFIQKVEDNITFEEMTKRIKDKQKIKKVLKMIEGLKVKETSNENVFDKMRSQDNYTFAFFEGETFESGKKAPYAFHVLSDGTFIFPYKDFNSLQEPRKTVEKHKELLSDIKKLLKIDF